MGVTDAASLFDILHGSYDSKLAIERLRAQYRCLLEFLDTTPQKWSALIPVSPPNDSLGGADHDPVSCLYPVPGLLPPPSP